MYGFDGLKTRIEEQKAVMKNVEKNLEILHNALIQIRVSTGECDRMARQCDSKQRILEENDSCIRKDGIGIIAFSSRCNE